MTQFCALFLGIYALLASQSGEGHGPLKYAPGDALIKLPTNNRIDAQIKFSFSVAMALRLCF